MERHNSRGRNDSDRRESRSQGDPKRYDAVCSSCGKDCQVPFKPIKGKPILCVNCYKKDYDKESVGHDGRMEKFKATCDECGKECEVPFKPNGRKPVLCSKCYAEEQDEYDFDDIPKRSDDQIENKLNMINAKLDEIIRMLGIVSATDQKFEEKIVKSKKKLRQVNNIRKVSKSKKKDKKKTKSKAD